MVADAKAVENKRVARKINAETERQFRGSWSGYERDKFFHNPDGPYPRFFDAGYVMGLDFDDDGRAGLAVDIDGDGDLDLALCSLQGLRLMENTAEKRHFARLRLTATATHPLAIGARVRLSAGGVHQQEYVRIIDGFLSQVPADMHFGLGSTDRIDSISVAWPSGKTEEWKGLPADAVITLVEGDPAPRTAPLAHWPTEAKPAAEAAFKFDMTARKLEGGEGPIAAAGKPAVLNFWAPDCAPCKEELPRLAALAERYGAEAQFAGISAEMKDLEAVRATVAGFGLKYPQFVAGEALLRSFYGSDGRATIPATFVFDGSGRLRRAFQRAVGEEELATLLNSFRDEGTFAADLELKGQDALLQQRYRESLEWFGKANDLQPGTGMRYLNMGLAWLGLGNLDEATRAFETAVRIDPGNAQAQVNLGTSRFRQGRALEAIACFEAALTVRGEDAETLVNLGNAAASLKKSDQARDAFERAIKADPRSVSALTGHGKVLLMEGNVPGARKSLEAALAVDGEAAEAKALLAKLPR